MQADPARYQLLHNRKNRRKLLVGGNSPTSSVFRVFSWRDLADALPGFAGTTRDQRLSDRIHALTRGCSR